MSALPPHSDSRTRLLDAAVAVMRAKGYSDSSVDDVCAAAGLTKGAFFHHFDTKEGLAVAAAEHFGAGAAALFGAAPYRSCEDPRDRVLGYLDFRASILSGPLQGCTCLLGTMVQETYATHPAIREACGRFIAAHAAEVAADIALAKRKYAPRAAWSPESLGRFTQAVLQGAFVLAKATNSPASAADAVAHLRAYVASLLPGRGPRRSVSAQRPTAVRASRDTRRPVRTAPRRRKPA